MMMKMQKGFTLVEIIVAMGLLSLVSVAFSLALINIFSLQSQSRMLQDRQHYARIFAMQMERDFRILANELDDDALAITENAGGNGWTITVVPSDTSSGSGATNGTYVVYYWTAPPSDDWDRTLHRRIDGEPLSFELPDFVPIPVYEFSIMTHYSSLVAHGPDFSFPNSVFNLPGAPPGTGMFNPVNTISIWPITDGARNWATLSHHPTAFRYFDNRSGHEFTGATLMQRERIFPTSRPREMDHSLTLLHSFEVDALIRNELLSWMLPPP